MHKVIARDYVQRLVVEICQLQGLFSRVTCTAAQDSVTELSIKSGKGCRCRLLVHIVLRAHHTQLANKLNKIRIARVRQAPTERSSSTLPPFEKQPT